MVRTDKLANVITNFLRNLGQRDSLYSTINIAKYIHTHRTWHNIYAKYWRIEDYNQNKTQQATKTLIREKIVVQTVQVFGEIRAKQKLKVNT